MEIFCFIDWKTSLKQSLRRSQHGHFFRVCQHVHYAHWIQAKNMKSVLCMMFSINNHKKFKFGQRNIELEFFLSRQILMLFMHVKKHHSNEIKQRTDNRNQTKWWQTNQRTKAWVPNKTSWPTRSVSYSAACPFWQRSWCAGCLGSSWP